MAREKTYSEVLNLRVEEALSQEVKRIAGQHETSDSDAARRLLAWGVEAHRAMEAHRLLQRYDAEESHIPLRMKITVRYEPFEPEYDDDYGVSW
ncbi:MAG TPA: hypothetical protein VFU51_02810 [Gaiellaceae bacterium]|jgi:hypothetical protein|nr:hypothetical protein [Gaiellaceae bacterium]